ncbi:hypothetical protein KR054_004309 [Drosophila jambulina]|nr:hypothetical protein KR054_004309 [Drosophila jambulina]
MAQLITKHYVITLCLAVSLLVGSLNAECCTDGETKLDPDDCTKYLQCCSGEFVSKSCDYGWYWNSECGKCEIDDGSCNPPYCVDGEVESNPDDCAGYLECVNGTVVVQTCQDGYYFNETECVLDTCGVCVNCTEGSQLPDLGDCTKYKTCINGKYVSQSCQTGYYWNKNISKCELDNGQCNGSPSCTEGEVKLDPQDCAGYLACSNGSFVNKKCADNAYFNNKTLTCTPDTDGVCLNCTEGSTQPDPSGDCTQYQLCSGGKYVTVSCGAGQYWNTTEQKCLADDNGQCRPSSCTEGQVKVDPADCAGYLACSNGSFVNKKCGDNAYFNNKTLTCTPDTEGVCLNCTEGSTQPEPSGDCTQYQLCSGGKYVTVSCGAGQYWNSTEKKCLADDNGQCRPSSCTEGQVKIDPADCAGYLVCSNGSFVNKKCGDNAYFNNKTLTCTPDTDGVCLNCTEGSTQPDPSGDCTQYQLCSGGKYVTLSCGAGQYWNSTEQKCLADDNGQCRPSSCTEGQVKVDPTDCAGYLVCSNGSYVNKKCGQNEYFDTDTLSCAPDTNGTCVTPPPTCEEGDMKANPADCAGYLQCVNGVYVARKCSANQFFNATSKECVVDTDGVCIPKTCDPQCCDLPNNSMGPVDKNCSAFFQCINGNYVQQRCPNNLQFNAKTGSCDYPDIVGCDDGTAPPSGPSAGPSGTYCESQGRCVGQRDGKMFAAADACSSAYVVCQCECEVDFSCSSGLVFNEAVQVCDWPSNVKC